MPSKLRQKTTIVSAFAVALVSFVLAGCGVKGDPVPPQKQPEIGRGQPTYRKATEGIQLKKVNPASEEKEDKEPEDE